MAALQFSNRAIQEVGAGLSYIVEQVNEDFGGYLTCLELDCCPGPRAIENGDKLLYNMLAAIAWLAANRTSFPDSNFCACDRNCQEFVGSLPAPVL